MKKFILLLSVFLYSFAYGENNLKVDSTTIVTPEGFGQYLSELLINRGDIKDSPIAVNINTLLPNTDFSKYEGSPANFILSILKEYQISLPQSWDRLLFCADNLNIDDKTNYVKTFFSKTHNDKYKCVAVLKNSTKFYALTFEVLSWKKDSSYVIDVNDKLREFNSIEKLIKDYSEKLYDLKDKKANTNPEIKVYQYNKNACVKIKNKTIQSYNSFVDNLNHAIKEKQSYVELTAGEKKIQGDVLEKHWKSLISYIQKNDYSDLQCKMTSMNNTTYEDVDVYNVCFTYRFSSKNRTYTFFCFATLVNENWKLIDISPFKEEPEFKLQF